MYFQDLLSILLLVTPILTTPTRHLAIAAAHAANIDPYGPIPTDYNSHINDAYQFNDTSAAATWARAQPHLSSTDSRFVRRIPQPSPDFTDLGGRPGQTLTIGVWAKAKCQGVGEFHSFVHEDVTIVAPDAFSPKQNVIRDLFVSYSIAGRGMKNGEQLDFSTIGKGADGKNAECARFQYLARDIGIGCHEAVMPFTCFRLWHN